jgi:hypothetical protein
MVRLLLRPIDISTVERLSAEPTTRGTIYPITPAGKEAVVHSFCWLAACTDGTAPYYGPIRDYLVWTCTRQFGGVGSLVSGCRLELW